MAKVKKALTAIGKAGLKTVADLDPVSSFFKNVYEEYTSFSAKERAEKVAKTFEDRLEKLEKEIGKQKIVETPNLASLFANAQNGALTDIESDKVGLYANAFINAIKNEKMEDTKKHIFLNMLREFTVLHIEILKFFAEDHKQKTAFQSSVGLGMRTLYDIFADINPIFNSEKELIDAILRDLHSRALLKSDRIDDYYFDFIGIKKGITPLGQEFLSFVSKQEEING